MPPNSPEVRVNSDGLKLGWNIVAILASLAFSIYLSSIISPIITKVDDLARTIEEQEVDFTHENKLLRDRVRVLEDTSLRLRLELRQLKRDHQDHDDLAENL